MGQKSESDPERAARPVRDTLSQLRLRELLSEVQDRVAAYILTVAWINLGVGIVVALGAWAMGLPAPIMWGGLAMLLNFIPYVGPLAMTGLLVLFGVYPQLIVGTIDVSAIPLLASLGG